jgi:phosphoribosylaminoimidazole-succinocarboxamide synthase
MEKVSTIYNGVSVKIYQTEEPDKVIIHFTDEISAFMKIKRAIIKDKGKLCNGISCMLFRYMAKQGIKSHFIKQISEDEQYCMKVEVIPIEVIVRNVIAGSMAQRLGLEEGVVLKDTVYDLCLENDGLNDPLLNDYHVMALGIATRKELDEMYAATAKINECLKSLFEAVGITLVDFKIQFGRLPDGTLVLDDDITPDSARLWDIKTGEKLDKDRFRHDNGKVGDAYRTVFNRLKAYLEPEV